jgi:hypothetical protein
MLAAAASMNACARTMTWEEEVLLHDGTKIFVKRTQVRAGAGEIGQGPPITEQSITFTPAGSRQKVTWRSEFDKDLGRTNFDLLALDLVGGTPYVVASPTLCSSYNKWGRPNPPYILFKYQGGQWKQISIREFPVEIRRPNVVINTYRVEDINNEVRKSGFVSVAGVNDINGSLQQEEYKSIVREPIARSGKSASAVNCTDLGSPQYTSPRAPRPSN